MQHHAQPSRHSTTLLILLAASTLLLSACAQPAPREGEPTTVAQAGANTTETTHNEQTAASSALASIELIESWPSETTLDDPQLREAAEVWVELIDGAKKSLDFEHFYAITAADSALEPVIAAVERAADRGVAVRFIVDAKFYKIDGHAEVPARLDAHAGIEVRVLDLEPVTGGVQHSKFFVVDGERAVFGSQNFDWRSLEHIHELGLVIESGPVAAALAEVFEIDWAIAGGMGREAALAAVGAADGVEAVTMSLDGEPVVVRAALSPRDLLADGATWDLPLIIEAIDGAKTRVRVQVMSYAVQNYDGSTFTELDDALRRAAGRGVAVELLVANWQKSKRKAAPLKSLQEQPNITVRFVNIPEHSGGRVPFARVIHSKYVTVDGERAWLGTSNWSGDYFLQSRNVGVMLEGAAAARRLDAVFERIWESPYAETVDPRSEYEAPDYK